MITSSVGVPPQVRIKTLRLLGECTDDFLTARQIEAGVHALCSSRDMYGDKIQQIIFNLQTNLSLKSKGANIILSNDAFMARGTIIEDIARESADQRLRFDQMVQEKYDMVNRTSYKTTMRCRRCGSDDVACEQKQTRGILVSPT